MLNIKIEAEDLLSSALNNKFSNLHHQRNTIITVKQLQTPGKVGLKSFFDLKLFPKPVQPVELNVFFVFFLPRESAVVCLSQRRQGRVLQNYNNYQIFVVSNLHLFLDMNFKVSSVLN